jgi:hypothetical protein
MESSVEAQETKNRTSIQSSNTTPRHTSKRICQDTINTPAHP